MSFFTRDTSLLDQQEFDVVIVGGGISGAWIALHCAQSGYKTALLEQGDFASQTSSASSKLLHGGIRYLQQLQFGRVRESAMERARYVQAAPHLSSPVPFLVPTFRDLARSKLFLGCGMLAYRVLTLGESHLYADDDEQLPPPRAIGSAKLNEILCIKERGHTGAQLFYERHMHNAERMVLAILRSAASIGAHICNYCSATKLLVQNQQVQGLQATDHLNQQPFEIHSKMVVNAAGPWIDDINGQLNNSSTTINSYAVGSHIITRQLSDHAIAITTKHQSNAKIDRGGRHVFIIPWQGHSLIGTSYQTTEYADKDLLPKEQHIVQLLEAVQDALPEQKLRREDVLSGYSGLYPLQIEQTKTNRYQGSGEYIIIDHFRTNQVTGLITALGAKFTTGRKLSALTLPLIAKQIGGKIAIHNTRLQDADYDFFAAFCEQKVTQYRSDLPQDSIRHLARNYGSNLDDLLALGKENRSLFRPLVSDQPDIFAQLIWAIREEQAYSLKDILLRRTSLGYFPIDSKELQAIAGLAATELGWSDQQTAEQIVSFQQRWHQMSRAIDLAFSRLSPVSES